MNTCPVCGNPMYSPVCSCGYVESRDSGEQPKRTGGNRLMPDPIPDEWFFAGKKDKEYPVFGNQSLMRSSVRSVNFVDSLAQKGADAWDVSEARDETVWAWTVPTADNLVDLYIGANGRVLAPENSRSLFSCYKNTENMHLNHLFTDEVTNMHEMFKFCSSLTTLHLSHFNTANVTNMRHMFYGCENLTALDVFHFDTAKVTDMELMFSDCRSLTALDLSSFNTANVTDIHGMFLNCQNLTTLDLSHFDTARVCAMYAMFSCCYSLTPRGVKLPTSEQDAKRLWEELSMRWQQ